MQSYVLRIDQKRLLENYIETLDFLLKKTVIARRYIATRLIVLLNVSPRQIPNM